MIMKHYKLWEIVIMIKVIIKEQFKFIMIIVQLHFHLKNTFMDNYFLLTIDLIYLLMRVKFVYLPHPFLHHIFKFAFIKIQKAIIVIIL